MLYFCLGNYSNGSTNHNIFCRYTSYGLTEWVGMERLEHFRFNITANRNIIHIINAQIHTGITWSLHFVRKENWTQRIQQGIISQAFSRSDRLRRFKIIQGTNTGPCDSELDSFFKSLVWGCSRLSLLWKFATINMSWVFIVPSLRVTNRLSNLVSSKETIYIQGWWWLKETLCHINHKDTIKSLWRRICPLYRLSSQYKCVIQLVLFRNWNICYIDSSQAPVPGLF